MKPLFSIKEHKKEEESLIGYVLWENEKKANRLTAIAMCYCALALLLCMFLTAIGIFKENKYVMYSTSIAALIWHLLPCIISYINKFSKPWDKYLLLVGIILGQARVDCGLGFNVMLSILIPVIFSTRYYSRKLTLAVAAATTLVFTLTTYLGAVTSFSPVDQNILLNSTDYPRDVMILSFFPKWLIFMLISGVCAEIAERGREMVYRQASISQEHSRVETELSTASQIQLRALPKAQDLLARDNASFELATSITPAKEVGGDFYDFFYVDPTHLAIVIADVSGKGVPAALFMMISKILLDRSAASGKNPAKVLTQVNHQLCEKNLNDMFVTVWLGIVDLMSGKLTCANAGHENPIICHNDGHVEIIKTKHGLVLGGLDGVHYQNEEISLNIGDTLFIYTDGIPEAHDPQANMYGVERLISALQNTQNLNAKDILNVVQHDVTEFSGDEPQFDDSTMVAFRLKNKLVREGLHIIPNTESIVTVQNYIAEQMEKSKVPVKCATKMNIAIDEMYSNIVHYSGASWAQVVFQSDSQKIAVVLRDNGVPYNPLSQADPDINQSVDERRVGGLGVYMTKKMLTSLTYRFECECNEITMTLALQHDAVKMNNTLK